MLKKILLLFVPFLLTLLITPLSDASSMVFGMDQPSSIFNIEGIPGITWSKIYSSEADWDLNTVIQTDDGGYIAAGVTNSNGFGLNDGWILKLDSLGDIEWQKTIGGAAYESITSILQNNSGGYTAAGSTSSFGTGSVDFWVMTLDKNGNILWQKAFGGSGSDFLNTIYHTSDGGYIVGGDTGSYGSGSNDAWIIKLDSMGSIEWQKTYGLSSWDLISKIFQTSDGGFIAAGGTRSNGSPLWDAWILRLDSSGSVLWQKTYGGVGDDLFEHFSPTNDGGFLAAGYTTSFGAGAIDVWAVKIDISGNILWQKAYGDGVNQYAQGLYPTSDNGFIISSSRNNGFGSWDAWLLKLDFSGNIEWQKLYGGENNDDLDSIFQAEDGGYIVVGSSNSFGNQLNNAWILKTDNLGEVSSCNIYMDATSSISNTSALANDFSTSAIITNATITDLINTPITSDSSVTEVCSVATQPDICQDTNGDDHDYDEDGLPDQWEICGYDHDGDEIIDVDLPAMGADPNCPDIFVEVDYMIFGENDWQQVSNMEPSQDAIDIVVDKFQNRGYCLHVDFGPDSKDRFSAYATWGDIPNKQSGGGSFHSSRPYMFPANPDLKIFDINPFYIPHKLNNFDPWRSPIFHYAVFSYQVKDGDLDGLGVGWPNGTDLVIGLRNNNSVFKQAQTFMHELGHNIGLCHNGPFELLGQEGCDKPTAYANQHISVMNYYYEPTGLHIDGRIRQIDYSGTEMLSLPLNENQLSEPEGLFEVPGSELERFQILRRCHLIFWRTWVPADEAINWNCNFSPSETSVQYDINRLQYEPITYTNLYTYDEWSNINLDSGCIGDGNRELCFGIRNPSAFQTLIPSFSLPDETVPEFPVEYDLIWSSEGNFDFVAPGETSTIPLTLTNGGELTATVNINVEDAGSWFNIAGVPNLIELSPHQSTEFEIIVEAPNDLQDETEQSMTIVASTVEEPGLIETTNLFVHSGVLAWFTVSNGGSIVGQTGLEVEFMDLSIGEIQSWQWDFGDGSTSNVKNPSHIYDSEGFFTVSLTVTGPLGNDTYTRTNWIWIQNNKVYLPLVVKK